METPSHWINGEPNNADEMNLLVQREMSNLKALKRLSLNTAILSQDPDLPTLDISDDDSGNTSPQRSPEMEYEFRGQRQNSLNRQSSFSRRPSFSRQASFSRQGSLTRRTSFHEKPQQETSTTVSNTTPRFAKHHSITTPSVNVHRERSAPVRSNTSHDEPVSLLESNEGDDIQNMWVPAGMHPELAPNEWHAFVEAKLTEIRKSQEAPTHNRSHSRLSHIVSDPEEYIDASALLYQRRAPDDRRKSILELSRDFVEPNNETNRKSPEMELGATSLRRSTHRMHKPEAVAPTEERKRPNHSLRRAGKMHSLGSKSPSPVSSPPTSSPLSNIESGTVPVNSVPAVPKSASNSAAAAAAAVTKTGRSTLPNANTKIRPPLSISIAAAKAVAHTAEQPPSPSAATPSPTASVMLGYRRRMRPANSPTVPTSDEKEYSKNERYDLVDGDERSSSVEPEDRQDSSTPESETPIVEATVNKNEPNEPKRESIHEISDAKAVNNVNKVEQHVIEPDLNVDKAHVVDPPIEPNVTKHEHLPETSKPMLKVSNQPPQASSWSISSDIGQKSHSSPLAAEPMTIPSPVTPKEEKTKPERNRWKLLNKSASSPESDSSTETSPPSRKTSFANLFKKNKSSKSSSQTSSHEKKPNKKQSNQKSKSETVSNSGSHSNSKSHSPGTDAPEPPPHSSRPKKGHARVHSRVSNDPDKSDINSLQQGVEEQHSLQQHQQQPQVHQQPQLQQRDGSPAVDIKLPYDIPAHQVSDRSYIMMYHRFPIHIERAIYRLSHMKLTNPRRPLLQQVLLSNFMYAYLNLINYGYQQQQLAAFEEQQQQQQQHQHQILQQHQVQHSHLEESQIEQLKRLEEHNYEKGLYVQAGGAEAEDSSSSSEDEDLSKKSEKTIY